MRTVNHPKELDWKKGPLPPVESVPDDTWALVWIGKEGRLGWVMTVHPWYDALNPRRWCESGGMPIGAYTFEGYKIEWYAWMKAPENLA